MTKEDVRKLHSILMDENFSLEEEDQLDALDDVEYDFTEDLDDLVSSEATLSEGFKEKSAVIMETAIKSKLKTEIARLEESYQTQLEEDVQAIQEELVDKIDSYLDYVVENWMEDNKLAIQNGLRTEIAENFMKNLKDLFIESYIDVPEEKVDLVDDLAEQVEALEKELNESIEARIDMSEELEEFKRQAIIIEMADDLADTQIDKLASLSESVDFDDEDSFRAKLSTIKETYFGKKSKTTQTSISEDVDAEDTDEVELSENMSRYVEALRKSNR